MAMQYKEEIKSKISLSSLISKDLRIIRSGNSIKALCPFHQEKTPSFIINDQKGFYYCFGCGAQGDIFSYVMEKQHLNFMQALEKLAQEVGVQLPKELQENYERNKNATVALFSKPQIYSQFESATGCATTSATVAQQSVKIEDFEKEKKVLEAIKIWNESTNILEEPAKLYLGNRKIDLNICKNLRYHTQSRILVALVTNKVGEPRGIQRIYFDNNNYKKECKSLGDIAGNTILLTDQAPISILVEGLEDGLTLAQSYPSGYEVRVTLGAGNNTFDIPDYIEKIVASGDNDKAGLKFNEELTKRAKLAGKDAISCSPPSEYKDWNAYLLGKSATNKDGVAQSVAHAVAQSNTDEIRVLDQSATAQQLVALDIKSRLESIIFKSKPKKEGIDLSTFMNIKVTKKEMAMYPILPMGRSMMIYAKPGKGKTFVGLAVGLTMAIGGELFNGRWYCNKPRKVLYLDGEMGTVDLQERLSGLIRGMDKKVEDFNNNFRCLSLDSELEQVPDFEIPDLSTSEGRRECEQYLTDIEVLIIDNLSVLCGVKENEADDWHPIQQWILKLRKEGIAVILIHHAGKNGSYRGSSKKIDGLDTLVALNPGMNFDPTEGAQFKVEYDKARGFFGADREPFEAVLKEMDEGKLVWIIKEPLPTEGEIKNKEQVLELLKNSPENFTPTQVAEKLGKITKNEKSGVRTYLNRLEREKKVIKHKDGSYEAVEKNRYVEKNEAPTNSIPIILSQFKENAKKLDLINQADGVLI